MCMISVNYDVVFRAICVHFPIESISRAHQGATIALSGLHRVVLL